MWRLLFACAGALSWGGVCAESEVHCEISSASFAWGPSYGGTVIAPSGAVALFEYDFGKHPGDREALFGENWLAPTRQELTKRYRPGRRVVGNLCPERRAWLREQLEVVRTAGRSKVVDMQSRDGPMTHAHCFVFETVRDAVTLVFLQQSGDSESHSLAPAAPRLVNWLHGVSAEAQRRAGLLAKETRCIDDPPLTDPTYPDAGADLRRRAMEELKATQQLHCQFAEGNGTEVGGDPRGNWDGPARLSVVFTDLDSSARRGHAETFGDAYSVRIDTSSAGLLFINTDAEKNNVSDVVTIVPYRIGKRAIYPALKHEIRLHELGAVATRYTGQCVPLPKSL